MDFFFIIIQEKFTHQNSLRTFHISANANDQQIHIYNEWTIQTVQNSNLNLYFIAKKTEYINT
jgi:hypothetical protein